MNQIKKIRKLEKLSFFDKTTLSQLIDLSDNSLYSNIKRWIKNNFLIQLKKGFYVTSEYFKKIYEKDKYLMFIANKLREPSYLSLEYVLQKYSILSESVFSFTSITLKTKRIYKNKVGLFIYRNISQNLFIGFMIKDYGEFQIKEATKAKALFDYLYLKLMRINKIDKELLKSYRLNLENFDKNDQKEFVKYCKLTNIKKYINLMKDLKQTYDI